VSDDVGKVSVPEFDIDEITGVVRVLLVSVCVPVFVTTVLSIVRVASPDVAPPDNPVPAITAVISAPSKRAAFIPDIEYLFVVPSAALTPNKLSLSVIVVSSE
jgi:hypothetical protein